MYVYLNARTNEMNKKKKENENMNECVCVYLPVMRMHKQLSQRWNSLVLWMFRKWAWNWRDRNDLQPIHWQILYDALAKK